MNRLSDATLNGMTKKQLIEYVRMCEHWMNAHWKENTDE